MILPVIAYGSSVLKTVAKEIDTSRFDKNLIDDMWETMYNANGIGLAAPQIGQSIRLFVIDTTVLEQEGDDFTGIKKVFINPTITAYGKDTNVYEEGCLSIPKINEDVKRPILIEISYLNEAFEPITEQYEDFNSRVIQHEYDHIEGILFTDKINSMKKRLLKGKLQKIAEGKITPSYKMKFPK